MHEAFRAAEAREVIRCGCGTELPPAELLRHLLGGGRSVDFREHVAHARPDDRSGASIGRDGAPRVR